MLIFCVSCLYRDTGVLELVFVTHSISTVPPLCQAWNKAFLLYRDEQDTAPAREELTVYWRRQTQTNTAQRGVCAGVFAPGVCPKCHQRTEAAMTNSALEEPTDTPHLS